MQEIKIFQRKGSKWKVDARVNNYLKRKQKKLQKHNKFIRIEKIINLTPVESQNLIILVIFEIRQVTKFSSGVFYG